MAEMMDAEAQVKDSSSNPGGLLRVTSSVSLAMRHIAPYLPELHQRYPRLSIEVVAANRYVDLREAPFVGRLKSELAWVAFVTGRLETRYRSASLSSTLPCHQPVSGAAKQRSSKAQAPAATHPIRFTQATRPSRLPGQRRPKTGSSRRTRARAPEPFHSPSWKLKSFRLAKFLMDVRLTGRGSRRRSRAHFLS